MINREFRTGLVAGCFVVSFGQYLTCTDDP